MTKERILKDCEFDAAYKIYCMVGEPHDVVDKYENEFGANGLTRWAKDHYPDSFRELAEKFKYAVNNLFDAGLR